MSLTMEQTLSNPGLSHLATDIFFKLDMESLAKPEVVCKSWRNHS